MLARSGRLAVQRRILLLEGEGFVASSQHTANSLVRLHSSAPRSPLGEDTVHTCRVSMRPATDSGNAWRCLQLCAWAHGEPGGNGTKVWLGGRNTCQRTRKCPRIYRRIDASPSRHGIFSHTDTHKCIHSHAQASTHFTCESKHPLGTTTCKQANTSLGLVTTDLADP